jgi:hypothetical protein
MFMPRIEPDISEMRITTANHSNVSLSYINHRNPEIPSRHVKIQVIHIVIASF